MNFLSSSRLTSAYTALRGDLIQGPQQQTAVDTIDKLVQKIQTSEKVSDRKTAVLGLKGCTREYREIVGERGLASLIAVLQYDAPNDPDIAKAVLETLMQLMEVPEKPARDDPGLRFMDAFFEDPTPTHSLLSLIHTSPSFYPRFYTLQFLSQLLVHRTPQVQDYLISAPPPGVDGILSVLDPSDAAGPSSAGPVMGGGAGEMLRNECLLLLPGLLAGNADLQKIVAFSGAFEKLIGIIDREGGIEGGIIVQDVLVAIGSLLRFNVSNQNYFRELSLIPLLPPMLYFPSPSPPLETPAPDDFTLQYWPEQKLVNAGLVLGLIRMLVGSPGGGNQSAMVSSGVTRCLLELALSSNAPAALRAQALNTITPILQASPVNQGLFSSLALAPLLAVPADEEHPNGGFIRLSMRPAVVALIGTILEDESGARDLRLRAAGVNAFDAYVTGNEDIRLSILSTMTAPPTANPDGPYDPPIQSAGSLVLNALTETPLPGRPFDAHRTLFACMIFAHLVRNSEKAKSIALNTAVPISDEAHDHENAVASDDEEEGDRLMQVIISNMLLAQREQVEAANRAAKEAKTTHAATASALEEEQSWNRVVVAYLIMLCTWLWENPKGVAEFLGDGGNIQVLTQPITQPTGVDPLVQGLSAFLLGVCYEFNREPGQITRANLHHILHSRIGPDQFVSRLARVREDSRFRKVQPDQFDQQHASTAHDVNSPSASKTPLPLLEEGQEDDLDVWFDWTFVDFWKNNYYTIQRSIAIDPEDLRGASGEDDLTLSQRLSAECLFRAGTDPEAASVIGQLRDKIKAQTEEISDLHAKLATQAKEHETDRTTLAAEIESLSSQVTALNLKIQTTEATTSSNAHDEEKSRGAAVAELEEKVAVMSAELDSLRIAKENSEKDVQAAREATASEHETTMETLRRERDTESSRCKELEAENAENSKRMSELEAKLSALQTDLEKAQSDHEKALEALRLEHARAMKEAEETHAKAMKDAQATHDDKLATASTSGKKQDSELEAERKKREELEKEHEDLLVLLEELSQKRKADKAKMREADIEVSEDEDGGEGGDEDDE